MLNSKELCGNLVPFRLDEAPHVMATGRWNFRLTASAPTATILVSHPMSSLAAERLFFDGFW